MSKAIFLTINVPLDDLPSVLALYDRIQVWRSTTDEDGTYTEITADTETAAIAKSTIDPPWDLAGKTLTISLSGADPVSVIFSALVPPADLRVEDVIKQINAVIPNLARVNFDSNAVFDLVNPLTGTGSSIALTGNAVAETGLPTAVQSGKGPRILIGLLNTQYRFRDLRGEPTYWYKTRFYSTKTHAVSEFSEPRLGDVFQLIPTAPEDGEMSKGVVNWIDITGRPVRGRRIILVPVQELVVPYNNVNYNVLSGSTRYELTTDEEGYAEVYLVRGATVRAYFEGSGFTREFVVPDQDFDLLTVLSTQPDPFSIVQAPPMPIRES